MLRILEMTHADLEAFFKSKYGKGPFLANALYREFYKQLNPRPWDAEAIRLSPGLAANLKKDWVAAPDNVVERAEQEGVVKFVTELNDGNRIETVVISMATHHTVCVSSQVGCRRGCRFCETAKMGLIRDLGVPEIVEQVVAARHRYGKSVRNVVFMGMGEPMDNFDAVLKAIQVMNDQRGLDIAHRHITLSTVGVVNGIEELTRSAMPRVNLAISLNAADNDLRSRLMPVNLSNPLQLLKKALQKYTLEKEADIMINYVLIPGVNNDLDCANQLIDWLSPLNARVNLIPLNPGGIAGFQAPSRDHIAVFRGMLVRRGVNAQERHSRGRELMAACGQLSTKTVSSG
ncbi:MAG: 23S rRNA (adenine(2503)-C(2))-methyltransferase RlmN [Thermodesulfobacteriota bacterium]